MIEKHNDYLKAQGNDELFDKKYGFKDINYSDLIELYKDDEYIPYAQYLRTNFWKTKRLEVLDRDKFKCQTCGGYDTTTRKSKAGEVSLEWSDVEIILWTDMNGNEHMSFPTRPSGKPDKSYNLQVHHKKYIINKLPWGYENKDLITLCNYCHSDEHKRNNTPIYDENGTLIIEHPDCSKCAGRGYIPEYNHVQGGICFKCGGTGFNLLFINKKLL